MKSTLIFLFVFLSANLFGQNVNIPDANFKAYLVGEPLINTNGDSEIQVSEASTFSGAIFCYTLNISDLTGIEAFTSLTELQCYNNQLISLNVSNNNALTILYCDNNQITSLDVSNNTNLIHFSIWGNQLTSLDVSNNTALSTLECTENNLTSLDVSNNTALTGLGCSSNQLTSLDVSSNTALTRLRCIANQLTSLDVSNNTALEDFLDCSGNQLTSLDVSNNTALNLLDCSDNQLTYLDVSTNTDLVELYCRSNQLQCLNVNNSNNINFLSFYADNNPNLTCIEVDNVSYSTNNWPYIDSFAYFSLNCNNACSNTSSISELNNTSKQLIHIIDVLGRETRFKPNTPLLYIYDDGTVERKMTINP